MNYKIIANPFAGSGAGRRAIPRIQAACERAALDYALIETEHRGHGIELAMQGIAEGYDVLVAAGGDGTVNEVINGIIQSKSQTGQPVALGILCAGRGNDFADALNIPFNLEEALAVLVDGHRRTVDVGRVFGGDFPDGRYFGNCVGIGFDAVTTIEAAKLPRLGGFLSFLVAVLKTIFLYHKGPVVEVQFDEHSLSQPALMVSIMNGRRLGGGFWTAPNAEQDDGRLDLCIAHQVSRRRILTLLPYFIKGTQETQDEITMGKASSIKITAIEGVLPAQADGEILCTDGRQLKIEVLPHHLDVLCPPITKQA